MNFEHVVRCENLIGDVRTSLALGGLIQDPMYGLCACW